MIYKLYPVVIVLIPVQFSPLYTPPPFPPMTQVVSLYGTYVKVLRYTVPARGKHSGMAYFVGLPAQVASKYSVLADTPVKT